MRGERLPWIYVGHYDQGNDRATPESPRLNPPFTTGSVVGSDRPATFDLDGRVFFWRRAHGFALIADGIGHIFNLRFGLALRTGKRIAARRWELKRNDIARQAEAYDMDVSWICKLLRRAHREFKDDTP